VTELVRSVSIDFELILEIEKNKKNMVPVWFRLFETSRTSVVAFGINLL